ncbi:MAG: phosphoenolpyruvate synthase, partial [Nitrososphaeraceae archaeon]|nr:phosphoenolpyruvate synthase [Nitrososphaeraceae archaeon]
KINKMENTQILVEGVAVGDKISSGKVKIIHSLDNRNVSSCELDFNDGDVLVTDMTDPDWEPLMIKASAIITNRGGRTCHASIISRELGINAIVGTGNCTDILKQNQLVTVSCAEGDVGYVYDGLVTYDVTEIDLATLPKIQTSIMFNIASPNDVFKFHNYPTKGVGLVREEFIINSFIKVHPMALINFDKLEPQLKKEIEILIKGYDSPKEYYIEKLCFGLGRIASAFYPNDVIVRFSDFKSNEYRNLLGGWNYEPEEENAMIGFRGASRYYSDHFKEAFGLECLAIKRLREKMGLTNVIVMIPFCRTVKECIKVQEIMKEYGLERGVNGLQVYVMCEIPSNVILADQFCKYVDGFSIGSNDLTQLTLGLDRDSELVAHIYDERNDAVKIMISWAIEACKRNGVKIGICGQGPSDYPDFAEFLLKKGIDSISITPDAFFKTITHLALVEKEMQNLN